MEFSLPFSPFIGICWDNLTHYGIRPASGRTSPASIANLSRYLGCTDLLYSKIVLQYWYPLLVAGGWRGPGQGQGDQTNQQEAPHQPQGRRILTEVSLEVDTFDTFCRVLEFCLPFLAFFGICLHILALFGLADSTKKDLLF